MAARGKLGEPTASIPRTEIIAAGVGFDQTRRALAEVMGVVDRQQSQQDVIDAAQQGETFALEFCRLRARCVMTTMGKSGARGRTQPAASALPAASPSGLYRG